MTATPAAAVCKHLRSQNDGQTSCAITGATMPRDCAAPREADADSRSCIPILALLYAQGERAFLATLDRLTRETVMATAANVKRRLDAGLINTRRDRPAEEAEAMRAEEQKPDEKAIPFASMTAAQLTALADKARAAAREKGSAEKRAARVLPALKAAKTVAESRLEALEVAIEEAEAGKAVDLKALRVKISRRVSPTPTTREAIKRTWTPERRAAQRARALETNAKRRKAKLAK
jgi:hypothetical protein